MSEIDDLRGRSFVIHDGYVFFATDSNDRARNLRHIQCFGPARAQDIVNHEPLRSYLEDLNEQEQFGRELQRLWSAKLRQEFPELRAQVLIEKGEGT